MPLYEYHCKECNQTLQKLIPVSQRDDVVMCDKDHVQMKRVIGTPGLKMEGKGWYSPGTHVSSGKRK